MAILKITLRTISIKLPDDVGNYIISTGCGSGKTYWLERFAMMHYWEGMLIVVDSIVSANTLYSHLINLGIDSSDVMMIHSQADFGVQNEYANNPEDTTRKKVLIMTNVRLYTEYPPVYLLYDKNGVALEPFDGDWKKLMNNPKTRRWIIIDEIPGFIQNYATVSKPHLGLFGEDDGNGGYKPKALSRMREAYDKFIAHSDIEFFETSTALGKLRTDTILSIIQNKYAEMMRTPGNAVVQFTPSDLCSSRSLVLIMEGAGDILFKDSSTYEVVDFPQKYRAKAHFQEFSVSNLSRRNSNHQAVIKSMVAAVITILGCVKGQTLIVCWNDFKGDDTGATSDDKSSNESPIATNLSKELSEANIPQGKYSIIYYGSAESKAVNTYKDYSNIILLGKWSLPISTSSDKFNKAFKTNTTITRYMLWEYVQLITRTSIRQGKDIKVFYTDDHNKDFMSTLEKYLNQNTLDIPEEHKDWRDKVKMINNGKRVISHIERLVQRFPYIPKKITEGGKDRTITITLKEINSILGKKKKRRDYKLLTEILRRFGIFLDIK